MFEGLQSLWWFLVLIGIMILLHELGHYLVARLFDVHVEAFSFGFGPRLFGFKRGETDFRFCAFLLGGYVKMAGEQPGEIAVQDAQAAFDPRSFPAKPRWQRLCIIFAGPAVNFVLALFILTGLFMFEYPKVSDPPNPVVGSLQPEGAGAKAGLQEGDRIIAVDGKQNPNFEEIRRKEVVGVGRSIAYTIERNGQRMTLNITPVVSGVQGGGSTGWSPTMDVQIASSCCGVDAIEKAGLKSGDIIVAMNGTPIRSASRLVEIVDKSNGQPIEIVYRRSGKEATTSVTPAWSKDDGKGRWRIGAALQTPTEIIQLPFRDAVVESWRQNQQNAMMIYRFLQSVIEQRMSPKSIDGPIGIAVQSGRAAKEGAVSYLNLMAAVSLNLAVVNLLPIPLLDGGGILMLLIEMLMQRDLSLRVKEGIVKVGFAFLMMVIVFVIYNDISKILPGG